MKRFWEEVQTVREGAGFGVRLDRKPVLTPLRRPLILPTQALAEAIMHEWAEIGPTVSPGDLALTQLANVAIDKLMGEGGADSRAEIVTACLAYAENDLICYRADHPAALAHWQAERWDGLFDWAMQRLDAPLRRVVGVMPAPQPAEVAIALRAALDSLDPWRLSAAQASVGASGSLVIALALALGRVDGDEAARAALADEDYQAQNWGIDAAAQKRRDAVAQDLKACARFVALL